MRTTTEIAKNNDKLYSAAHNTTHLEHRDKYRANEKGREVKNIETNIEQNRNAEKLRIKRQIESQREGQWSKNIETNIEQKRKPVKLRT